MRLKKSEVVPYRAPDVEVVAEGVGGKNKKKSKRALSPEKKQKKMKGDFVTEDTPLVLTAAEKGRVISHVEEPSLEEAALDRKKFMHLFGHIFPFGAESIFYVNIKRMKSAKAYQVLHACFD